MATLTIRNRDNLQLAVNPAISLLQLLGRHGVDVPTRCGGRARCGYCKITVLSGLEKFAPMNRFELHYRQQNPLPDKVRLACQSYLVGDAEIMIGKHTTEPDGGTQENKG